MKYKKWSLSEKLEILSCSEENGIIETCRKYSVSTGALYSWKIEVRESRRSRLKSHL